MRVRECLGSLRRLWVFVKAAMPTSMKHKRAKPRNQAKDALGEMWDAASKIARAWKKASLRREISKVQEPNANVPECRRVTACA